MTASLPEAFLQALRSDFPPDFSTDEPSELAEYGRDWTRVHPPAPSRVVFPRSTDEVSRFMRLANLHRVPVVPSGGRTGLAAGAVAAAGEVVLSMQRMSRLGEVDLLGNSVRVQAGAITEAVHRHAAAHGLVWPVDFASKGSSQVGGNIATNAGGVKVIRYGLTRQWVLGLQVVTAQGEVLELNGALEKNNTGTDLRQLFIGSEGTLGIITEATLKLTRLPERLDVMLFAVRDLAGVLKLFREARRAPLVLSAYEFFTDRCLTRVLKHRKLKEPFEQRHPFYVLLEAEGMEAEAVEPWLGSLFERGLVLDGTLAQGPGQAQELWSYRESISESLSGTGFPYKNDIALPVAGLEAFCTELEQVFASRYPDWEICNFGHIGDGNLHVNVMKPEALSKEDFLRHTHEADQELFALVRKHRGSVSAEHGIGLMKKHALPYSRTPQELAIFRALKNAMDPNNILNPGKIVDVA